MHGARREINMSALRELLSTAVAFGVSDIHIKVDSPGIFRLNGALIEASSHCYAQEEVRRIVDEILPAHERRHYETDHESDFSLQEPEVGRFRATVFHSHGLPVISLRHVKTLIPSFVELHLPPSIEQIALVPRGIIIASGSTGSGKSTTLAAMIQHINLHQRCRIITIEDPVEFVFEDRQSIISQREVGLDTPSFHSALKHVLRQDPDVIMIGEMRDAQSFIAALTASETGHLIFTTMHTDTAGQAVSRILNFFPPTERDQVRMSLATNLQAVICQRLTPACAGGVVPAVEILRSTPTVRKLIEKNNLDKLPDAIETGGEDQMQTFNQSIYNLIKSGVISEAEGMLRASNPEALKMNLKGIFLDEARRILST